jgi:hypothetical protein
LPVDDPSAGLLMPYNAGALSGNVLNARGEVAGVLLHQAASTAEGRVGWQMDARRLQQLLQGWGVPWRPYSPQLHGRAHATPRHRTPDAVQMLRRAAKGTVLVACHRD